MFFWGVIFILFAVLLGGEVFFLMAFRKENQDREKSLGSDYNSLKKQEKALAQEVEILEKSLAERFLFYDIARKTAPIFKKKNLVAVFFEEIRHLGQIDKIELSDSAIDKSYLKFELGNESKQALYIKTKAKSVIGYIPYFANLLRVCLERIKLYEKLQELSIHDALTKIYNRRYFTLRYLEEFQRAKKFNLNLSFLMIDIDYFKKINDNYGHLVGDAVLREVARLIKENTREIDFVARFGGEEFAAILLDTDKAGAIMVAERISSRISRERIKVFDETLSVTVSVGVASFPQNTLHSDVLMEISDKALYKAKLSGRNRVCWF